MADQAPYPGKLKEGDRGPAVTAVQSALHVWGVMRLKKNPNEKLIRHTGATGDFGHPTALQLGHFQDIHNIPVTNTFGPQVHVALAQWYTDAGTAILRELAAHKRVAQYHSLLQYWCNRISDKRDDWTYTQDSRRMDLLNRGGDPSEQRNVYGDCSSTAGALITLAARIVGLPDPGLGNWFTTYTLINQGLSVSYLLPQVGDRFHYGSNSHVAVYMGFGKVCSFGGEPGPRSIAWNYRPVYAVRRDFG